MRVLNELLALLLTAGLCSATGEDAWKDIYSRFQEISEEWRPPNTEASYSPKGKIVRVGDMDVYETGEIYWSSRVLMQHYDVFGLTPNAFQLADLMAEEGYFVVIPDTFRGEKWDIDNWPPNPEDLKTWLEKVGPWETRVKPDIKALMSHYGATGWKYFGIYGVCYGGYQAFQASQVFNSKELVAAASVHPAGFTSATSPTNVIIPYSLTTSMDEPDMTMFCNGLKNRWGPDSAKCYRVENLHHGFAGARGNFSDAENFAAVQAVVANLTAFFDHEMYRSAWTFYPCRWGSCYDENN